MVLVRGPRILLRPLVPADACEEYLAWLNDPEVNRYSRRAGRTETMDGLMAWLSQEKDDLRLAIMWGDRHIGGISLGFITDESAELSIMIGAKDAWGHGFATEAVRLLTDHAHNVMGLRRVWAESPNPAFNATMRKLGWTHEATKPKALNGMDVECWASVASSGQSA